MRPKGTAQELANRRRLAVQRVRDGYSVPEVAAFLGTTERSVRRWLADAREYGDRAGLAPKPHTGPRPRLDVGQQAQVIDLLDERPTAHGFATDLWTAPRVAQLILRRFGVRYHPRYVNAWLRQRRVRPVKPRQRAKEQDPEGVRRWLEREWPPLLDAAAADGGWLVFVDEAGLLTEPLWRRTQARRGHPPVFDCPAAHRRKVSALAALAFSPLRQEYRLLAWTMADAYFDSAAVALVLGELAEELPGPIRVVWDRGSMHKGDPIRQAKARLGDRLGTTFLPAYTPEANPVEQLWSLLKYSRLANFVPRNLTHLNIRACQELDALAADQQLLRGCFDGTILPRGPSLTLAA